MSGPSLAWRDLYILDLLALGIFGWSYYRNCYRKGYRIDFWHAELFLFCVFPNMIMLPFARSELNVVVLGDAIQSVIAAVPTVFLITLLGFAAVLLGGRLWLLKTGLGLRRAAERLLDVVPRCSLMVMSSRSVLIFQAMLCLLLQASILTVYFSGNGFAFDLRSYTFENPTLRPIALIISNYSILIASHCLARYVDTKERVLLASTLALTFGLIFFGARGNLLAIFLNVLLCYFVKKRSRVSVFRIAGVMATILIVAFYLGSVRAGEFSFAAVLTSLMASIFYGNNFSDLRDFAWVYSSWDHVFWSGKTYLAALSSFVPRFASHFRDTWGLGVVTASTAGLDPQVHPGLRPGIFGEGFFNFGLVGVIAVGLIVGIILRRVDIDVKNAFASSRPSMTKAFASTMLLGVAGSVAISAGFSGLYTLAAIYVFSWLCLSVKRMFHLRRAFSVVSGDAI